MKRSVKKKKLKRQEIKPSARCENKQVKPYETKPSSQKKKAKTNRNKSKHILGTRYAGSLSAV